MKPRLKTPMADLADEETRALLELRAERLRSRSDEAEELAVVHLAEFQLGSERLAFPLEAVRACLPLKMVTPVPLAPPEAIGLFRYDAELLPAYSLSALLGGRAQKADPTVLLVIDRKGGGRIAVDCEQIPMVTTRPRRDVEAARKREAGGLLVQLPDGENPPVGLLDVEALFASLNAQEGGGGRAD